MPKKVILTLVASLGLLLFLPESTTAQEPIAQVENLGDTLVFHPTSEFGELILTVSGPCDFRYRQRVTKGEPFFRLDATTIDGTYTYDLVRVDPIDPGIIEILQDARKNLDEETPRQLCRDGKLPGPPASQSEGFSVSFGEIVYDPFTVEKGGGLRSVSGASGSGGPMTIAGGSDSGDLRNVAAADFVIIDDLIVDGSACIGFDCVNGESFGFDTIRLKENNLRIKFDDTSTAASFPRNDWQLTANDSANGGASKFSIDDISGSRTPFTVEANARSHSLYVDDGGRIGSRTSTPSTEIHTIDGDTPTLRLQQDGSSGFAPQTWDVAGNETNFFIRDVTNGSQLPFRIRPDAPTSSIDIATDGDVGIGTASPSERIHLTGTDNPKVLIEDTSDNANDKPGLALRSPAANSGGDWFFEVDNGGQFQIDFGPSTGPELIISDTTGATNGTVTINGNLMVNGTCTGCDAVFQPSFELESIEEHTALMWENNHLPAVGPTPEGKNLINVFEKTTGILQELEKAHIYIDQLHQRLAKLEAKLAVDSTSTE